MSCRLIRDIKHSCEYNPGGIKEICLLDIRDFISYRFLDDKLYNTCYADLILEEKHVHYSLLDPVEASNYYLLDTVEASNFTEVEDNGMYKQILTTFIHTLNYKKASDLLLVSRNKYLVVFRTYQDTLFSFGSDGGAAVEFGQISGQMGEAAGYNITMTKNSIYPLVEVNGNKFNKIFLLSAESKSIILAEDRVSAILK
jgi:hypothetical protein